MMSSYASDLEEAVFQSLVPELEGKGFSVFVHPSKNMLPSFLKTFQPDAIAYRGKEKIFIEVVSENYYNKSKERRAKIEQIRDLFSTHPDWELRVIFAPPREGRTSIPALPKEIIEEHLQRIEKTLADAGAEASLLMVWATFEAAARRLFPADLPEPQPPARLLEKLASEGYVTPDEADVLRSVGRIRNQVAHGRLDLTIGVAEVKNLIAVTRTILNLNQF